MTYHYDNPELEVDKNKILAYINYSLTDIGTICNRIQVFKGLSFKLEGKIHCLKL